MELIKKTIGGKYLIEVSQKELDGFRNNGDIPLINLKDIKSLRKAKRICVGQRVLIDDCDKRPYWVCFIKEDENGHYFIRVGERFKNRTSTFGGYDNPKNPCIICRVFKWKKEWRRLGCVTATSTRLKGHPNDSKGMKKKDTEAYKRYDKAISGFEDI